MQDYIHSNFTFRIKGNHFHKGEYCYLVGESETTITQREVTKQVKLKLLDCPHGTGYCYATREQLELVIGGG